MAPLAKHGSAPGEFPLCDQLRFSRRFARLLTRGGLRIGNAARNNFAAVFDDFPIPATVLVIGHNAEFNAVCHVALGSPPALKDFQNKRVLLPMMMEVYTQESR